MNWDEPLDVKGLAKVLKRSRGYIADMKTCGFPMVGGRATLRMAFNWLARHEDFRRRQANELRLTQRVQKSANGNTAAVA